VSCVSGFGRRGKYEVQLRHQIVQRLKKVAMGNIEEEPPSLSHKERDKTRLGIENHVSICENAFGVNACTLNLYYYHCLHVTSIIHLNYIYLHFPFL